MGRKYFKCNGLSHDVITFTYALNWEQEQITTLKSNFFAQYSLLTEVEHITGADLEVTRFKWQEHDFNLFFECYSHAIWVECPEANSLELLHQLTVTVHD